MAVTTFFFRLQLTRFMIRLFTDDVRVLRLVIAASGKRLHEIGRVCNVSGSTISQIANGITEPSPTVKARLAELFGVDEHRLFRPLKDEVPWAFEVLND